MGRHVCDECAREFDSYKLLRSHKRTHKLVVCPTCGKRFNRQDNLKRHRDLLHAPNSPATPRLFRCRKCDNTFFSKRQLIHHGLLAHQPQLQLQPFPFESSPWIREDGSENVQLREIYQMHRSTILAPHDTTGKVQSTYNLPLDNQVNVPRILDLVKEIYQSKRFAFR
jgi:uncharacterized Zn-finger protein